ncbi:MAG: hypothetical protein CVU48_01960 [Candidatus Cloacimonetes bacterium HGW-Cloacimonetes-1]|nr:MAG: hypothetical protein CVU48_01960 [Candidatus Cloacimonetes bacterium HGW-Cloacimonetes-1]
MELPAQFRGRDKAFTREARGDHLGLKLERLALAFIHPTEPLEVVSFHGKSSLFVAISFM